MTAATVRACLCMAAGIVAAVCLALEWTATR